MYQHSENNNINNTNTPNNDTNKAALLLEYPFSRRTFTGKVLTFIQRQILARILNMERPESIEDDPDDFHTPKERDAIKDVNKNFSHLLQKHPAMHGGSSLAGFLALLLATCVNYMLGPMRDAAALAVGVENIPILTLISTILAIVSSVPIGWLFEAPDPKRRQQMLARFKLGFMTRGETQGTSLALFYRFFAIFLGFYAAGFKVIEILDSEEVESGEKETDRFFVTILRQYDKVGYSLFYLFVHLMKLHSISLIWGVASESMEFEEITENREKRRRAVYVANAIKRCQEDEDWDNPTWDNEEYEVPIQKNRRERRPSFSKGNGITSNTDKNASIEKLAFVGFGGTIGGIAGSLIASTAGTFHLSGLLFLSMILLELSAELSIELGKIMKRHWKELQRKSSHADLSSLSELDKNCDSSIKRSSSYGSMKRISSGNSIHQLERARSNGSLNHLEPGKESDSKTVDIEDDSTFSARLLRGISTILRSNLLMAIFTYNALFASTSVLLSFQRAELVANRKSLETSAASDTAFLAKINMISGMAVFFFQASGMGAFIARRFGQRGSLSLMPFARLLGVLFLAWWHLSSNGKPPNLMHFLIIDEFTRVINFSVAKPVREGLWRGLSNEARYEAKPIVDTIANRWGGGSAAFLVSMTDRMLRLFGKDSNGSDGPTTIFGFPPVMFLCLIISVWWAMVSAHVGHIRSKIDVALKKHR